MNISDEAKIQFFFNASKHPGRLIMIDHESIKRNKRQQIYIFFSI